MSDNTTDTGTVETAAGDQLARAQLFQALANAAQQTGGMPMPFEVHFQAGGNVMLRYRTVEEVDGAVAHIGGQAGYDSHTHKDKQRRWHSYGTEYGGGRNATWAGWPVRVWAAVDGPSPIRKAGAR